MKTHQPTCKHDIKEHHNWPYHKDTKFCTESIINLIMILEEHERFYTLGLIEELRCRMWSWIEGCGRRGSRGIWNGFVSRRSCRSTGSGGRISLCICCSYSNVSSGSFSGNCRFHSNSPTNNEDPPQPKASDRPQPTTPPSNSPLPSPLPASFITPTPTPSTNYLSTPGICYIRQLEAVIRFELFIWTQSQGCGLLLKWNKCLLSIGLWTRWQGPYCRTASSWSYRVLVMCMLCIDINVP